MWRIVQPFNQRGNMALCLRDRAARIHHEVSACALLRIGHLQAKNMRKFFRCHIRARQDAGTLNFSRGRHNHDAIHQLIPAFQPADAGSGYASARRKNSTAAGERSSPVLKGRVLTQHTGLPPRPGVAAQPGRRRKPR